VQRQRTRSFADPSSHRKCRRVAPLSEGLGLRCWRRFRTRSPSQGGEAQNLGPAFPALARLRLLAGARVSGEMKRRRDGQSSSYGLRRRLGCLGSFSATFLRGGDLRRELRIFSTMKKGSLRLSKRPWSRPEELPAHGSGASNFPARELCAGHAAQ
jgi:hypothetical protein